MSKNFSDEGIVLKRRNFGEADRIVTIFTQNHGKITVKASGVRKITSRRASSLEPGTQVKFAVAKTKAFDILTQTQIIDSFATARNNLERLTQINQILEIVDRLTPESQSNNQIYSLLVNTLNLLKTNGSKRDQIIENIKKMLQILGFGIPEDNSEQALKSHIEEIIGYPLRSKKMLLG